MSNEKTYRLLNKKTGKEFDATETGMSITMQNKKLAKYITLVGEVDQDGNVKPSVATDFIEKVNTIQLKNKDNGKGSEQTDTTTVTGNNDETGDGKPTTDTEDNSEKNEGGSENNDTSGNEEEPVKGQGSVDTKPEATGKGERSLTDKLLGKNKTDSKKP